MADDNLKNLITNKLPEIAPEETSQKFSAKMRSISVRAEEKETAAKASLSGWRYINLIGFPISPEALVLIAESAASQLETVCFFWGGNDIRLGSTKTQDPAVQALIKRLETDHNAQVTPYLISPASFEFAFKLYSAVPKITKSVRGVEISEADIKRFEKEIRTFRDLENKIKNVSITDLLTLLVAAAVKSRASDIHIETEERSIKVRFRIDGILHDVATLEPKIWPKIISRVKLVSGLKINVDNRPQDGRFTIFMNQENVEVRVSTLPTAYGESVVIRLLMFSVLGLAFEELGLRGRPFEQLKLESQKPNGMIITTGPTGSGKTTTLYAILNRLNNPGLKIITIEDPIEYKLPGINQSQVERGSGYTFANGLRNIVRQDPDIVMVGEIRDLETAEIAINAALTGHLVLTTLHTNDASGTIPRLIAMNVKTFLLAPAINAMIGQRLLRRICQQCKKETELDNQTLSRVYRILAEIPESSGFKIPPRELKTLKFYQGGGCEACQGIGYKGRIGIFEILTMNKEIENLILSGHVSEFDMRAVGVKYGMITMIQDGLLKASDGLTSVEEVFRIAKDIDATI